MAVLQKGNLLYLGETEVFIKGKKRVEIASDNLDALMSAISDYPAVEKITRSENIILLQVKTEFDPQELNKFLFQKGIVLSHLSIEKHALETQFLELTSSKSLKNCYD